MNKIFIDSLVDSYSTFQSKAYSPFHVVSYLESKFYNKSFKELSLSEPWDLKEGNYFIKHVDGKSLICFCLRKETSLNKGFMLLGAHTDSPVFRLRSKPQLKADNLLLMQPQVHGGMILRSWLDLPIKLAGIIHNFVKDKNGKILYDRETGLPILESKLVNTDKAIGVIPDLAIHLDREKNSKGELNAEKMMSLICGSSFEENDLDDFLIKSLKLSKNPDGFELSFTPDFDPQRVGIDGDFLVSPRHDDLAMVFSIYHAIHELSENTSFSKTPVGIFLDSEETGSVSSSGAASNFVFNVLEKIRNSSSIKCKDSLQDLTSILSKTLLVSADMAHAYHPSHPSKFDQNHKVHINSGIVIKENANDRYATSSQTVAWVKGICEDASIPVQQFINRQDMSCGSTIGPILSAQLSCLAVDLGIAMWGMHSSRETLGCHDLFYICEFFKRLLLDKTT